MKKLFFCTYFFFYFSFGLFAQDNETVLIKGLIVDDNFNRMENVVFYFNYNSNIQRITDRNGEFQIRIPRKDIRTIQLAKENDKFSARKDGYAIKDALFDVERLFISITLNKIGKTTVDITQNPLVPSMKYYNNLDDAIRNKDKVKRVNLTNKGLAKFPAELFKLPFLEELILKNNQIANIPSSINKITYLKTLDLSYNQLTALPDNLGNLTNLNSLDLTGNPIEALPESMANLKNLKFLFVEKMTKIPNALRNNPQLTIKVNQTISASNQEMDITPKNSDSKNLITQKQTNDDNSNQKEQSASQGKPEETDVLLTQNEPIENKERPAEKQVTNAPSVLEKREQMLKSQIQYVESKNQDIKNKIEDIESKLKNDKNLSPDERNGYLEELTQLKEQLYFNGLALQALKDKLDEITKSFIKKYQNTLLISSIVIASLLIITYLFFLLAKRRRKQRDELALKTEEIQQQKEEILTQNEEISKQKTETDKLLLNILPEKVAQELKATGDATPQYYERVSVLFTDFQGFTKAVESLKPIEVIEELDFCFNQFDEIVEKYGLERIKTMGDAYMAVGGLPIPNQSNPIDAVKAGLEIQAFMNNLKVQREAEGKTAWQCRLGIHSGEVIAGVVGKKKFAYDIWGDTVNLAARMESSGEVGKVNISGTTYNLVKDQFPCEYRGKIEAKNKGEVEMYFVEKIL